MALEFAGNATPLDDAAIEAAAKKLDCQVAAVRAVIDVESRGGFLPDKRPKILFERHYFSRLTKRKFDGSHPHISHPKWGNYKVCGFGSGEDFVKAMVSGEPAQLDAFVSFVKKNGLADELIRLDWAGFARGYNGPAYKANKYDAKLFAAYMFHSAGGARSDSPRPLLKIGDQGEDVKKLQAALSLTADGDFGPVTTAAVVALQKKKGLYADGIVGKQTWAALDID